MNKLCIKRTSYRSQKLWIDGGSGIKFRLCKRKQKIKICNRPIIKIYENSKIVNNRLKGRTGADLPRSIDGHDAIVWKSEKYGDFGTIHFVKICK